MFNQIFWAKSQRCKAANLELEVEPGRLRLSRFNFLTHHSSLKTVPAFHQQLVDFRKDVTGEAGAA